MIRMSFIYSFHFSPRCSPPVLLQRTLRLFHIHSIRTVPHPASRWSNSRFPHLPGLPSSPARYCHVFSYIPPAFPVQFFPAMRIFHSRHLTFLRISSVSYAQMDRPPIFADSVFIVACGFRFRNDIICSGHCPILPE